MTASHSHVQIHEQNVHDSDLKPDNLLIDQHGHLKLTDFGLSRIGLLGRQTRESQPGRPLTRYNSRSRPPSMDSAYIASPLLHTDSHGGSSYFNQRQSISRVGHSPFQFADDVESSGSELLSGLHARRPAGKTADSPLQSFATELTTDLRSHSNSGSGGTPPGEQKFVGTPDYLAPETILGLRGDDAAVDWVSVFVFLYLTNHFNILPFSGPSASLLMSSCMEFLPSMLRLLRRCSRTFYRGISIGMKTGSRSRRKHAIL